MKIGRECLRAGNEEMTTGRQTMIRWTAGGLAVLCLALCGMARSQDLHQSGVSRTSASTPPANQRVDINHASIQQLLTVPGMTPSWAGRIVKYRPYRTKQDLYEKGIVTNAVYDRIKDFVVAHREKQ